MNSILLMFHCRQSTGYAIGRLEPVFIEMAKQLVGECERIHVSFTTLDQQSGSEGLNGCSNLLAFDPASYNKAGFAFIERYIKDHGIDVVFGFDQPVRRPAYRYLRRGGVKRLISYQGAPMSSLNHGVKLLLKKLDVYLAPGSPDHYIFESMAMAETAYQGRGIPRSRTSVIYPGVDASLFRPVTVENAYAHTAFGIPADRRIIYYSGHMEARKGVAVLVRAAQYLRDVSGRKDFQLLILGNEPGQEQQFVKMLIDGAAREHVTFGGYRDDVHRILPCCYAGAIASTGWDSFTLSALEIAACGLPLIASNLQGLAETVEHGETGYLFMAGDHEALATYITALLDSAELRNRLGNNGRQRILAGFTRELQVGRLVELMSRVMQA